MHTPELVHIYNIFCHFFQVEVFDILFVIEQDRKYVVHCQDCARKISTVFEGFIILNQYRLEELCEIYDRFQLAPHVSANIKRTHNKY